MFAGLVITFISAVLHRGPIRARWGVVIFVLSVIVFFAFMIAAAEETRQSQTSSLFLYAGLFG